MQGSMLFALTLKRVQLFFATIMSIIIFEQDHRFFVQLKLGAII